MAEHQGSFLKDLPASIKRFTYHNKQQFLDIYDSELSRLENSTHASEFLLFYASKKIIDAFFDTNTQDRFLAKLRTSFDTSEELFLVTLVSEPHSEATDVVNTAILQTLFPMGMSRCLQGFAGAKIQKEGRPRGKQPDYGWGPIRVQPGQSRSPTVTLEVGYSESETKLHSDVRFWLHPEDGNAKICLTLRIDRSRPEIWIEKWERRNDLPRLSQTIRITRRGDRTIVTDHPLVIPFESLFRRPSSCPRERDLEITQGQLEDIADKIWKVQEW